MEKLIFRAPRPAKIREQSSVIRVTGEAYNAVEALSAKTGFSNSFIASRMISFAAENTEVVFDEGSEEPE